MQHLTDNIRKAIITQRHFFKGIAMLLVVMYHFQCWGVCV